MYMTIYGSMGVLKGDYVVGHISIFISLKETIVPSPHAWSGVGVRNGGLRV